MSRLNPYPPQSYPYIYIYIYILIVASIRSRFRNNSPFQWRNLFDEKSSRDCAIRWISRKIENAVRGSNLVTLRKIKEEKIFGLERTPGSRKMEVETRFPPPWPGEISFSGPRRRSLERLGPRGSLPPRRHNTSHYVIRASLDTAIYHSSARIPIYRSSPYACKTLPISPIPLRPFSSLSTSPVERKEGR